MRAAAAAAVAPPAAGTVAPSPAGTVAPPAAGTVAPSAAAAAGTVAPSAAGTVAPFAAAAAGTVAPRTVNRVTALALGVALLAVACSRSAMTASPPAAAAPPDADPYAAPRDALLAELRALGVRDAAVLAAMARVPRHELVGPEWRRVAYDDRPLPIGDGQTISQPFVVAMMTELAHLDHGSRVLEVGTGSGYQAAVLAEIAADVYTIEIVEALADRARATLERLGYRNVHARTGDGWGGWPEAAPFDAIIVTAAAPRVPPALLQQLKPGGRLVLPVGDFLQELRVVTRTPDGYTERSVAPVRFVPMTGRAQQEGR